MLEKLLGWGWLEVAIIYQELRARFPLGNISSWVYKVPWL